MDNLVGHWVIVDCVPNTAAEGKKGIEGTGFELSRSGEVRWKLHEEKLELPLLSCDTYEIVSRDSRGHYLDKAFLRFGTYRGHILDFHVDSLNIDNGELVMSKSLWLLRCKKLEVSKTKESALPPFSFLPALEDGYFSDLDIVAGNCKRFRAHRIILKLSAPDLDWSAKPPPLTGLPEEVLGTTLHYLYAQCLPAGLPGSTAEEVVHLLADIPELQNLRVLCKSYLSHLTLKNRILDLLGEVHACATRMTESFQQRSTRYDPAKLCEVVKRSARDAAVAYAKLLLVSHLYNENKAELTLGAGQEVIRYIQSRGPVILGQLKTFLHGLSSALSGLEASQRLELACYLVPELELVLDTAMSMLVIVEVAVEAMLKQSLKEEECQARLSPLEQYLNRLLTNKELVRFDCFLRRITCIQEQLLKKKGNFKVLSSGNKVRSLACSLDQLIGEFPVFLLRLEEFAGALDIKFEWNESQFCFKVGTAKVCEMLRKLVQKKDAMEELMVDLCQLVDREAFSRSLVELGLLDANAVPAVHTADPKTEKATPTHCGYMLNLTERLCVSPSAVDNPLSRAAEIVLDSKENTDMMFEIVEGSSANRVPAHRVIVAARCDWFRRALLSGMQEDIRRRIEVHNSTPTLFGTFLRYLYTGRLATSNLTCSQLIELLVLGDCYEVNCLKTVCEESLKMHLREESVLELLDLADQLNALILRLECIKFISDHRGVLDQEAFLDLSGGLQAEVYDAVRLRTGTCMCTRPGRWRKSEGERRAEPEGQVDDGAIYRLVDSTAGLQINR